MSLKLGKSASSASHDFGGDIAEVLIFDRQLTSTENQQIEGYLATAGEPRIAASNHPYKDLPPIFDNSPKLSPTFVYPVGSVVDTWSPTAIVGNNAFEVWFDANDSSTVTGTTQITEWKDKSGNGGDADSPG